MMPKEGMLWRHVVISTLNSWLPGDPRGFRTCDHKIHSSGDYKNRPPEGEHAGLWQFSKEISDDAVVIPTELRRVAGEAMLAYLRKHEYAVLAIAVAATHAHLQVELPADIRSVKKIAGELKKEASHAIREELPGRVWGHGGSFKVIDFADYQHRVFEYILDQQDAWTWSYLQEKENVDKPKDERSESLG